MSRMYKRKYGRRSSQPGEVLRRYTGLPKHTRNLSDIGLVIIKLSTLAQRAINCVIGQDVNFEKPWVYIQKEKIEDNLELHSESSEFLPIANKIYAYPEPYLLICLKRERDNPNSKDVFYICCTIEVKERILHILENNDLKINNAVSKLMEKNAGIWDTLGSETEILEETMVVIRPLLAIEIECDFPIFKGRRKFSLSLANPDNWHFVEFLTEKRNAELVYRRRMTISVQVAPIVTDSFNQTMQICTMDQLTQTKHEYKVKELPLYKYHKLLYFLNKTMSTLSDSIQLNANINLFSNDYKMLASAHIKKFFYVQTPIKYFRDVTYSRNKYVSALVWHPKISGLVAAAYTHTLPNVVNKENQKFRRLEYIENVVLIWCYSSSVKPKLILHADREVVSLCFCPYNLNILVGGCTNGQIVIWDLTNKLEQVEKHEVLLTPKEERNRAIVESHTNWMFLYEDVAHVKPTAISNILGSHRDAVTSISWISLNFKCTKNGNIVKTIESEEPVIGGQFITSSLDGIIYFWDLNSPVQQSIAKVKPRKVHMPILDKVSPLSKLNHLMIPIFKILVESSFPFLPLTSLVIADQKFMYEITNPETANNTFERTFFRAIKSDYPKNFTNKFIALTNIGTMFTFTWSGYDFDQGNVVNYAKAEEITFLNWVHDAPIHTFCVNPHENNLLLTIGGKIFAIWNSELDSKALVWRKNSVRYNSGLWSVNNIGIVIMFRVDAKVELWDILVDSKSPARIIVQAGMATIDTFLNCKVDHVTKGTYFKTDKTGNMVLTTLMSKEQDRINKTKYNSMFFIEFSNRVIKRRQALQEWSNEWKEKHLQHPELLVVSELSLIKEETVVVEQKKIEPVTYDEIWQKKDYEKKLKLLIVGNNKLDPIEIERNKQQIIKDNERKNKIKNKLQHVLKCSRQIFESEKKDLLESNTVEKHHHRRKSSYFYGKNPIVYNEIKKMYMRNYYEIEKVILEQLQDLAASEQLLLSNLIEKRLSSNKNYIYGAEEIVKLTKKYMLH